MWTTRVRTAVLFAACLSLTAVGWVLLHPGKSKPAPPGPPVVVTLSPVPGPPGPPGSPGSPGPSGHPGGRGPSGVRTVYLTPPLTSVPPSPYPTKVTASPSRPPHPSSTCPLPPVPCFGPQHPSPSPSGTVAP